jgi:DNA-binding transcriptional LysR family regulator
MSRESGSPSRFSLLDPTSCKAFWFAAHELNFSKAALKAGMTQSGVSKHISKLESQLKTELFLRQTRKIALTRSGEMLLDYLRSMWSEYEAVASRILSEHFDLSGQVRYAMPESCLMSPHFSMLLKNREQNFPEINLSVTIAVNEVIENLILNGQVDFGFMTTNSLRLNARPYCFENYVLVSRKKQTLKTVADLKKLKLIGFPELDLIFSQWCEHFFKGEKVALSELNLQNTMNDLRGIVTMLLEGPSDHATLLPEHCIEKHLGSGALVSLNPKSKPVQNQIYMVSNTKALPQRVQRVQEEFFRILN